MTQPYLDFPYRIDGRGRTATTAEEDHIRDMIYQVLFTNPGERVNRPDFGCGIKSLVFMPNSDVLAAAVQTLVKVRCRNGWSRRFRSNPSPWRTWTAPSR